jgi:N-acyl-D-amino-acid deacylase
VKAPPQRVRGRVRRAWRRRGMAARRAERRERRPPGGRRGAGIGDAGMGPPREASDLVLDLLIRGGRIVDGAGNPWYEADVGVRDGRIAAIGRLEGASADRVIDAGGHVVAPGFIDAHSHSDISPLVSPLCESKVRQGVTTECVGQCGSSATPRGPGDEVGAGVTQAAWTTAREYLEALGEKGHAVNLTFLVGQGNLRRVVMGYADRPATPDELEAMKSLLRDGLEAGAMGLSTGLIYPPGSFAPLEEIISLARVAAEYGGLYATHMRDEGAGLLASVQEALTVGRAAGLPVQIAHHKVVGEANWGKVAESLRLIDAARADGTDVTFDQYPYEATSTGLRSIVPQWAHEGGPKKLIDRLKDPTTRTLLGGQVDRIQEADGGWQKIYVTAVTGVANKAVEGRNMAEIAAMRGRTAWEAAFDLLIEENLDVGMIRFGMCEEDIVTVMRHPCGMFGTDGRALAPYGPLGVGVPHPRNYGTFPRVLGRYVREKGILSLEAAIRKMTSFPAQRYGLSDRGLLRPGLAADITVFNPDTVADQATFGQPHQYAAGIPYVIVNGVVVVDGGEHTGATPGRVLTRARGRAAF